MAGNQIALFKHARVPIFKERSLFILLNKFIVYSFTLFIIFLQISTLMDTDIIRYPASPNHLLDRMTCYLHKVKPFLHKFLIY